jgi:hypothetical protein
LKKPRPANRVDRIEISAKSVKAERLRRRNHNIEQRLTNFSTSDRGSRNNRTIGKTPICSTLVFCGKTFEQRRRETKLDFLPRPDFEHYLKKTARSEFYRR